MKPVIKKHTHYNLLLMKDDGGARTFRVSGTVLSAFVIIFVVLLLAGTTGIIGGTHYWRKYRVLSEKHAAQDREVSEMRLQLERLVNLECLIVASNGTVPQAKNEELGVEAPANRAAGAAEGGPDADASEEATSPGGAPSQQEEALSGEGASEGQAQGEGAARAASAQGGGAAEQENAFLPLSGDESPLRISRFSVRTNEQRRVRISYELSTTPSEEMRTIAGSARYIAVFADGTKFELPLQDSDGTSFAIARMKAMHSAVQLPEQYDTGAIENIEVIIEVTGGRVYQEIFPVSQ